ncbi:MAG: fasciclin domain-containing protein [Bacteroidales bacterium]|nr:fasciclin domain-containing protein [Bacteroidales bacterium]
MDIIKKSLVTVLACMVILNLFSCKDPLNDNLRLEQDSNTIMVYLETHPSYSILAKALKEVKLAPQLNVYGTMTLFAPTDSAFQKLLDRRGLSDISEMDSVELRKILLYHLYAKKFESGNFISGSLPSSTVEGDFIQMDISNGIKNTVLNGSVNVGTLNIQASNGVVHSIDDVLEPPSQTLYEWLKDQPEYSIMLQAFEATGNDSTILDKMAYDSINLSFGKPSVKWRTVFLETNSVLAAYDIHSFEELAAKYSNTGDYTNPADSLNLFVRYHCLEKKIFLSDLRNDYIETFNLGAYLIFDVTSGIVLNKRNNLSVGLNMADCNKISRNGIVHALGDLLEIYDPTAVKLVMRFAGEPSDRNVILPSGEGINVTTVGMFDRLNNDVENQASIWWLKWGGNVTGTITSDWPANAFADYCLVATVNEGDYWVELTTKPVFKGKYRVNVTYRRTNNTNYFVMFYWDGVQMGDVADFRSGKDAFGNTLPGTDTKITRQVGIVNLTTMAPHKFKFYLPNPGTNYTCWYSMELIPI